MSLIITGIEKSKKQTYYVLDTDTMQISMYSGSQLKNMCIGECNRCSNFRINTKGKAIKKAVPKIGFNPSLFYNGKLIGVNIPSLIDASVDPDNKFVYRLYDSASDTFRNITDEQLYKYIVSNRINNESWRKIYENHNYKEYRLSIINSNTGRPVDSSIYKYVYNSGVEENTLGKKKMASELLSGTTEKVNSGDSRFDTARNIQKVSNRLYIEDNSIQMKHDSSEDIENGYNNNKNFLDELENLISQDNTDNKQEKEQVKHDGEYESNIDIETYKKIIYNMYPNDRITVPSDIMANFEFRILRIIDSSIDGNKKIAIGQINKTPLKSVFMLVQIDEENQLYTLQAIGHTDIPEKAMESDIEGFCMTYNRWLQRTKYF